MSGKFWFYARILLYSLQIPSPVSINMEPSVSYTGSKVSSFSRHQGAVLGALWGGLLLNLSGKPESSLQSAPPRGDFQMPREGLACLLLGKMVWLVQTTACGVRGTWVTRGSGWHVVNAVNNVITGNQSSCSHGPLHGKGVQWAASACECNFSSLPSLSWQRAPVPRLVIPI